MFSYMKLSMSCLVLLKVYAFNPFFEVDYIFNYWCFSYYFERSNITIKGKVKIDHIE